jgi:hypothetical protein
MGWAAQVQARASPQWNGEGGADWE